MTENDEFSGFTIEERGKGNLCAVLRRRFAQMRYEYRYDGEAVPVAKWESVFNEASLIERVTNLQNYGRDSSISQAALAALRSAKAAAA